MVKNYKRYNVCLNKKNLHINKTKYLLILHSLLSNIVVNYNDCNNE